MVWSWTGPCHNPVVRSRKYWRWSLGAIATTPQSADAIASNLTGSMFAAITSADGSTAVKTAAALAVICKLATERLWPATSADGVPHGRMRHLKGFLLLPARQGLHPALPGPQQRSQHPPTPPPPQEIEDSMLGKRPRDEPTDTNDSDTSRAGATLLTTITPARQVRLISIFSSRSGTRNLKLEGGLQTWHVLAKRWLSSVRGSERTHREK